MADQAGVMGPVTVKPRRWRKTASITHATLTVWRQSWGGTGGSAGATFEAARAGTDARRDPRRPVRNPRRPPRRRARGRALGRDARVPRTSRGWWRRAFGDPRESGEGGRSRARLGATRRRGRPRDARRSRRAVRSSSDPSGISNASARRARRASRTPSRATSGRSRVPGRYARGFRGRARALSLGRGRDAPRRRL